MPAQPGRFDDPVGALLRLRSRPAVIPLRLIAKPIADYDARNPPGPLNVVEDSCSNEVALFQLDAAVPSKNVGSALTRREMPRRRTVCHLLIGAFCVVGSACLPPQTPLARNHNSALLITADEIARSGAKTAWEAIRFTVKHINLQQTANGAPRRILRRGQSSIRLRDEVRIFVDDSRIADVGVLRQIAASDIALIRVLSGLDATTRYGTNSGDGVILISTRAGPQ